jgi:hypothetical protein
LDSHLYPEVNQRYKRDRPDYEEDDSNAEDD